MNNIIVNQLTLILNTYQSIVAFFYQRIAQTSFTNNNLATYTIDYSLLLPSSQYITILNAAQCNAQMQAYIDLCNLLTEYITNNVNTQTNLYFEQIQNTLDSSISQLNGFTEQLLNAQYFQLFTYKIPYNMSLLTAIYNNSIDLDTYALQASLNYGVQDFNNLQQGQNIILNRGG